MNITKKTRIEYALSENDRKSSRFAIPGATISTEKSTSGSGSGDPLCERMPVVDISRGGMAFLTNDPPKLSKISLLLTYAENEDPLRLEGKVAYFVSCGVGLNYRFRVGVEFAPFSTRKGHNSPASLIRLQKLEKAYGERDFRAFPILTED
jgi:hypothetical protein